VGAVPASAVNLVISEVNYNPADPTAAEINAGYLNANDFEFVELMNISANTVDLSDLQFTAGISFNFATAAIRELAPGARVVIVENPGAFAFRYGSALPVAGAFSLDSNLSNNGETLTLERIVGATVTTVRSFRYNDRAPWPDGTDGTGWTLTLNHPTSNPDHALPESWRPSSQIGGSPGTSDALTLATWMASHGLSDANADSDFDGYSNAAEFVLGTSPTNPASFAQGTVAIAPITVNTVENNYLTVTFDKLIGSDEIQTSAESSDELSQWVNAVRIRSTPHANGMVTEVWRSVDPINAKSRHFIRLKMLGN
jgi:hypothetical protein